MTTTHVGASATRATIGRSGVDYPRLLKPGWPLTALLALYPLWWVLGIGAFAFLLFSLPMASYLLRHRPVRAPAGFGLWLLFLLWSCGSLFMFPFNPPQAAAGTTAGRLLGIGLNEASYIAATIVLLYLVNLPTYVLPQRRLLLLLSWLFATTVAGGILGVVAPHFEFTAPVERLLPGVLRTNDYVRALVHPVAAQIQDVLGSQRPRPAAPFGYANFWGNNLSILLVWWIAFMWPGQLIRRRVLGIGVCVVALVPVVHSLDRALWLGLVLSFVYLVLRVGPRHRRAGTALVLVAACAASIVAVSPLGSLVARRAAHGESDDLRIYLTKAAFEDVRHSPILGYGGTRKTLGSNRSIAVGPSANCSQCGSFGIGSNGQFWLVLFSQGFVGALLYTLFFLAAVVRHWPDASAVGVAGTLALVLSLAYMFFYTALPSALILTMISLGALVRNTSGGRHSSRRSGQ